MAKSNPKQDEEQRTPKKKTRSSGANFANIRLEPHPAAILFNLPGTETGQPVNQSSGQPLDQTTSQPAPQVQPDQHPLHEILDEISGQPVNQTTTRPDDQLTGQPQPGEPGPVENLLSPVDWSTKTVNQTTTPVNQSSGQPDDQSATPTQLKEGLFRSRIQRRMKGIRLPEQKLSAYEMWCFVHKIDFQDAVEQAMDWLTSQPVDRMLINNIDDGFNDERSSSIAQFYQHWTGNVWNSSDRAALAKVSEDVPVGVVHCGILLGVVRKAMARDGQRINAFAYFLGSIEEARKIGQADPVAYLKYLRREAEKWKVNPSSPA